MKVVTVSLFLLGFVLSAAHCAHSKTESFDGVIPASGRWRYSIVNGDSSLRLSVQTLTDEVSLHLWKDTWDGSPHWTAPATILEVAGDLTGTLNLELRGVPGTAFQGSYALHCGEWVATQASESVETYQWYYRINQGQVVTYPLLNRFATATSITIHLTPLDSSCDPDLFVYKGKWSGSYGWKSERGYGEDSITIAPTATLKDITGSYTIEVHGGVPGPYVLRVIIHNAKTEAPVLAKAVVSDNVEEYYWYHTVATDVTDYYFFKNRFKNAVAIDIRLTPLSVGDPDLKVYKGQWTGVYDWVSSKVKGEEILSIKPGDMLLEKRGGIVGDYAIEIRGVFTATYRIEVKIYYNNGWARLDSTGDGMLQQEENSFLFVKTAPNLIPGSIAMRELAGGTEDLVMIRVDKQTTLFVSVTACLSAVELLVPTEQHIGSVEYVNHKGTVTATFYVEEPGIIRLFVSCEDTDYMGKLPYRVMVESDETFEMKQTLTWETLGADKLVVTWPPLRLSTPGTVVYRVFLSSAQDICGLAGQDIEVATSVPTAVLPLPEDVSSRAISVVAEVQAEDWGVRVPYLHKEVGVEGWNLVRLGVLAGLVVVVGVALWRRKGTNWTEVRDDEVYRRLIEERD